MKKNLSLLLMIVSLVMFSCAEKSQQETVKVVEKAAVDTVEVAAQAYFGEYPGSRIIPADKVFAAMDAGEEFLLLDIRKADDYAKGHLKGAVNAPWGPAIADSLSWLPDACLCKLLFRSDCRSGRCRSQYSWNPGSFN